MSEARDEDSIVTVAATHVTAQLWIPDLREDGVYLIAADDNTVILKMCRLDRESDLLMAGYIAGLQVQKLRLKGGT